MFQPRKHHGRSTIPSRNSGPKAGAVRPKTLRAACLKRRAPMLHDPVDMAVAAAGRTASRPGHPWMPVLAVAAARLAVARQPGCSGSACASAAVLRPPFLCVHPSRRCFGRRHLLREAGGRQEALQPRREWCASAMRSCGRSLNRKRQASALPPACGPPARASPPRPACQRPKPPRTPPPPPALSRRVSRGSAARLQRRRAGAGGRPGPRLQGGILAPGAAGRQEPGGHRHPRQGGCT